VLSPVNAKIDKKRRGRFQANVVPRDGEKKEDLRAPWSKTGNQSISRKIITKGKRRDGSVTLFRPKKNIKCRANIVEKEELKSGRISQEKGRRPVEAAYQTSPKQVDKKKTANRAGQGTVHVTDFPGGFQMRVDKKRLLHSITAKRTRGEFRPSTAGNPCLK